MDMSHEENTLSSEMSTPRPQHWFSPPASMPPSESEISAPKTPEPLQPAGPVLQPPMAPKEQAAKFRVRRRRHNPIPADPLQLQLPLEEIPIPSIELSYSHSAHGSISQPPKNQDYDMLSPTLPSSSSTSSHQRLFSPPRTPVAQICTSFPSSQRDYEWSLTRRNESNRHVERPDSSLSMFSDSSNSSTGSSNASSSFGESCTSPESDTTDPFYFPDPIVKPEGLLSPANIQPSKPRKRAKTSHNVKWTQDMDDHLWMTYMAYQTDPEITPFKALPGVAPPLGVCHRVAREAKRSWKGPRVILRSISEEKPGSPIGSLDSVMRESSAPPQSCSTDSPDVMRPEPLLTRSHSSAEVSRKQASRWPRSEASTRKRLRQLCKSKPHLPPHYQRLLQTRSPSPFGSSSSGVRQRSSRLSSSPKGKKRESSFSTGDLKLSLTANTLSSMQPGNPLSQLASDEPLSSRPFATWSSPSSSRGVHQKSQSLQAELGMGGRARAPKPLASPFHLQDNPFDAASEQLSSSPSGLPKLRPESSTAVPDSPWKIHAPRPMSGSMKRRAEYPLGEELVSDDLQTRRDFLQDLFRENITDGHRRVRSRGFSLGAMRQPQPTRQLSELFAPPAAEDDQQPNIAVGNAPPPPPPVGHGHHLRSKRLGLFPPTSFPPPRLRSPFAPSNGGLSNTFPRSLFPQGLDSISSLEQRQSDDVFAPDAPASSVEGPPRGGE